MMQAMNAPEPVSALLDPRCIEEIRYVERAVGRNEVLSGFIATLERNLASFAATFAEAVARGDDKGAARAAHSLKGACHQLGAQALGNLFADIERSARSGHYADAKRTFEDGAGLIEKSLQALKQA
jgi:HPt (histidine-containing phosphotransfer) domain-containing protein